MTAPAGISSSPHSILRGCRSLLLVAGSFSLVESLLLLAVPLYSFQMFDRVLTSRSTDTLLMLSIIAIGALGVMAILDLLRAQLLARVGMLIEARLSGPVLAASVGRSLCGEARGAQGLGDLAQIRAFLGGPGVTALFDIPTVPVFMAAAFLIHPALGWVAVVGAGVLLLLTSITHWATRSLLQASGGAGLTALQRVHADLRNADAIQAMGLIGALVWRWERENGRILALQAAASDRLGGLSALSKFARLLIQVLAMAVGSWLAIEQEITGGMMIAASIMTARGLAPIEQVLAGWNGMVAARQAWVRVYQLLAKSGAERTPMALPRPEGRLTVEKVMYAGGNDVARQPILKGISFTVEPGESLGIIGPTAAGKSTLIRLLAGSLTPLSGSVRLDGAEIVFWDRADIGRHIGYMPQDVQLLAGMVAENIARMAEPDPLLVVEAAKKAGVHELILQLATGYETPIGEGGVQLSGGQRQRIALARALYGSPRLLLLDEPNSSLDAAGEEALMRALAIAKQEGITVVLVSHRPNILQQVDRLAALRDGILETLGPREEVMAQFRRPAPSAPVLRTVRAPA